jgi:hypothetical protein
MTDDLVKRLRDGWTEDGVSNDFDEDVLLIAADRIEELEFVLRFISNINYGNGPDVTMEHQSWAKRALGEKTDD